MSLAGGLPPIGWRNVSFALQIADFLHFEAGRWPLPAILSMPLLLCWEARMEDISQMVIAAFVAA